MSKVADLKWVDDPDAVEAGDLVAMSGKIEIGRVSYSRTSKRWRWEIVTLPGDGFYHDQRSGWLGNKIEGITQVFALWHRWLKKAELTL